MSQLDILKRKLMDWEELKSLLAMWRFKSESIVFTNGCFDILHRGHIEYLSKAADLGNHLILGLNTDRSVRELKGDDRPLQNEEDRALILASLHFTDAIILFDEADPLELIKKIRPDYLVKAKDYELSEVIGAEEVMSYGGKVVRMDVVEGRSSSGIIQNLK